MRFRREINNNTFKKGEIFGRWSIEDPTIIFGGHKRILCKCLCGTIRAVKIDNLVQGISQSCGCKRFETNALPPGVAARNHMFSMYRESARKRRKLWELTKEQFLAIIKMDCYFCGQAPAALPGYYKAQREEVLCSGVDRLNNDIGYTTENSVSCCKTCNYAKRLMSETEFLAWVEKIYQYSIRKHTSRKD